MHDISLYFVSVGLQWEHKQSICSNVLKKIIVNVDVISYNKKRKLIKLGTSGIILILEMDLKDVLQLVQLPTLVSF